MLGALEVRSLWTVGPLTLPPDPCVTSDQAERAGVPAPAIDDHDLAGQHVRFPEVLSGERIRRSPSLSDAGVVF